MTFTVDWFTAHAPLWLKYTAKFKAPRSTRPPCSALMVGVYEGRVLAWLLENVMKDPRSRATVVNNFDYSECVYNLGTPHWNPDVRAAFEQNVMKPHGNRVDVIEGTLTQLAATMTVQSVARAATRPNARVSSHNSATTQVPAGTLYDIVYIDARDSVHALSSMTTAFELLVPGGVMIVQNYAHNREHDSVCPQRGIDAFVDVYVPSHAKVLSATFHFFLEKKKASKATLKAPQKACHIEGYPEPADKFPKCNSVRRIKN
eukprot:gene29471-5818_t